KIYGDSVSGNCLKVKWTADLLGVSYDWVETDILKGETRTPAFLALNPAGQVPLLITPKGKPLAQSNAILLYLAEKHGGGLVPEKALARAKVYEWLFWEQYSHEPYIAVRRFHKTYLKRPDAEIDPKLMERGLAALARMEDQLTHERWIAGPSFTAADIALVAYTRVAHEGGFNLNAFPKVGVWIARVEKRLDIGAA
ncbi:MAG: glutathione S-transferase family protein, partial [Nitrospiraceae bacterium]|nr:glutathione S-transferase family protein [Nitrospiraceae bacterium]